MQLMRAITNDSMAKKAIIEQLGIQSILGKHRPAYADLSCHSPF